MTELENLKVKLFEIVECIGALENKPNKDVITFTKEQLQNYSQFLIDEAVISIKTSIEQEICEDLIDEAIDLEISSHNREIFVNIDERAIKNQIISVVEDSIGEGGIECCVQDALEHVFPSL